MKTDKYNHDIRPTSPIIGEQAIQFDKDMNNPNLRGKDVLKFDVDDNNILEILEKL